MTRQPAVYILASKRNGTLYIGVTSDLQKRTREHKDNAIEGFTKRYGVHQLVITNYMAIWFLLSSGRSR
jgi:putative endonuclease